MPIKVYKPTTPARRRTSVMVSDDSKKRPERRLRKFRKQQAGRTKGRITVRHRGGGARRFVRIIDFKRDKYDIPGLVQALEYDPNRNASIALIAYADGEKRYIVAPVDLKVGDTVVCSQKEAEIKPGNRLPLSKIPSGVMIHDIELVPGKGGQMARSAGAQVQLMATEGKHAQLRLPSGEIRLVPADCMATVGQVSRPEVRNVRIGKAGRKRHMGIRPTVRGKVMNPCDHPHGGGEGSNPIGMKRPKTKWGKAALGARTRRRQSSDRLIIKRRKK